MEKYPGLQAGTMDIGPSNTEFMTVTITYKSFSQTPAFVATPLGKNLSPLYFSIFQDKIMMILLLLQHYLLVFLVQQSKFIVTMATLGAKIYKSIGLQFLTIITQVKVI